MALIILIACVKCASIDMKMKLFQASFHAQVMNQTLQNAALRKCKFRTKKQKILHSKIEVLRSENANFPLKAALNRLPCSPWGWGAADHCPEFCAMQIPHYKIEILCSENANFALKNGGGALNRPPRILRLWMDILRSENGNCSQCLFHNFCMPNRAILHISALARSSKFRAKFCDSVGILEGLSQEASWDMLSHKPFNLEMFACVFNQFLPTKIWLVG